MRKLVESRIDLENGAITNIHEKLSNTGRLELTKEPRTNQFTKDIIDVLNKHHMIDVQDDVVEFTITVRS